MPSRRLTSQSRLVVVGDPCFSEQLVRAAARTGWRVALVNNALPISPVREQLPCSISVGISRTRIRRLVRAFRPTAVTCIGSDASLRLVGELNDELGLPGPTMKQIGMLQNKPRFRALQAELGLPSPDFAVVASERDDLVPAKAAGDAAIVVKPVDSAGARGISFVTRNDIEAVSSAIDKARRHSRTGEAIVEDYVTGIEFGGDALVDAGRAYVLALTLRQRHDVTTIGHALWDTPPPKTMQNIEDQLTAIARRLMYGAGPLNFDGVLRRDGHGVVIFEAAARFGANEIAGLVTLANGVDPLLLHLDQLRLQQPAVPISRWRLDGISAGSALIYSEKSGRIARVASAASVSRAVREVVRCIIWARTGDRVTAIEHSGHSLGIALFKIPANRSYAEVAARVREAVHLHVE